MRCIDACAYLGHYPFRRVERTSAAELIEDMDARGMDQAVVSSLPAVFYRDARDGNLDLFAEIAAYRDRLIPAAVGNPIYNEAEADLERYVREFGCREIRLFPRQHGYSLTDERVLRYLRRCAALGVPAAFPLWLEDPRQAAPLDITSTLTAAEVRAAAEAVPEVTIVLHNGDVQGFAALCEPLQRKGEIYYDFGRAECLYMKSMQALIGLVGTDRLVFATSQPLQYPEAAMTRLAFLTGTCGVTEAQLEAIAAGNAARLLGL